jgi:hypothetical protein
MRSKIKKTLAIALSLALALGALNMFVPKEKTKTAVAKQKTVYDEIKLTKLPKKELDNVAKDALKDGVKAAKKVNSYKNTEDYKAALNAAMTSYYKKNDKKQLKNFTATLDKRGERVVANYKKAAKERAKGVKNGYIPGEINAIFDSDLSEKEIEDVCKAQDAKLKKCYKIHTGDYMTVIEISMEKTVDMASDDFAEYSFVQAADSNDLAEPTDLDNADSPTISPEVLSLTNDQNWSSSYHFDTMHVKGAWDYLNTHEHQKVKVAVIDVGCYYDNEDIANIITDDSYDVIEHKPITEVTYPALAYHGTAVIGTIAAESNNGKYISGVASGYDNSIVDILAINASRY